VNLRWLYWPLFTAVLGFALGGSVVWGISYTKPVAHQRPAEQAKHRDGGTTSTADQKGGANVPSPVVQQIPSDNLSREQTADDKRTTQQPEKSWWNKLWTDPNATFAGAVAFFTLALVVVGAFQARRLRQSVGATNAAVAETRRIGEAQVRAYVDITSARIVFGSALGLLNIPKQAHPAVSIAATNSGQSLARNFVWNPTLQYIGTIEGQRQTRVRELGANWRDILGVNIPVGGTHQDNAMISDMNLNQFMPEMDVTDFPYGQTIVVRLRIQFEFEDVFDKRIPGEAFFAGVFGRQTLVGVKEPSDWSGSISRMHKPNDWPATEKQNENT
jgi:hypothetical protein